MRIIGSHCKNGEKGAKPQNRTCDLAFFAEKSAYIPGKRGMLLKFY